MKVISDLTRVLITPGSNSNLIAVVMDGYVVVHGNDIEELQKRLWAVLATHKDLGSSLKKLPRTPDKFVKQWRKAKVISHSNSFWDGVEFRQYEE